MTIEGKSIADVTTSRSPMASPGRGRSKGRGAQGHRRRSIGREALIGRQILKEIRERLGFLVDVGLDYLTLDRSAGTLSGGEAQRIRLATQIGSSLMGVLYILDEPSIGLHQRDNARLIKTLERLRDIGNTLIVVEHDEDTMRAADWIVDVGPGAGEHGGKIVAEGPFATICANRNSLTGDYLSGREQITIAGRAPRGQWQVARHQRGAREQSEEPDGRVPARQVHLRHRRLRLRQEFADHRHPLPQAGAALLPRQGQAGQRTTRSSAWNTSTR